MCQKCCRNCLWLNGEKGDGNQFCDKLEIYVPKSGWCFYYVTDTKKKDESE